MNKVKSLSDKDMKKVNDLLTAVLVMNSGVEFEISDDDSSGAASSLIEMLNEDGDNKKFLVDCAVISALNVLGLTSKDSLKLVLGKAKDNQILNALVESSDDDIEMTGKVLANAMNQIMQN